MTPPRLATTPASRHPGRVGVIYVGGTIGARNLTPALHPDALVMFDTEEIADALRRRSDLHVDYEFVPLTSRTDAGFVPIVSSQVGPADWIELASAVARHYDEFDGFVVLHGTDTMAWTASALSFLFANLGKPVVLTGSQRPIRAAPSDAIPNFVNSVILASRASGEIPVIPEVVICFGNRILRGNRAQKVSSGSTRGFDSPNAPRLGRVGRRVDVTTGRLLPGPADSQSFHATLELEKRVADVTIYPGMSPDQMKRALHGSVGAILRTFGTGNAPNDLRPVLEREVRSGKVLVNVTQNPEGVVESGMLSGNNALAECGVISGLDLTYEGAFTKLMVLLGQARPDIAAAQMQLDLRGEQSVDLVELRAVAREDSPLIQRIVLSEALHARAQPDRLTSAVLRLGRVTTVTARQASVGVCLNNWGARSAQPADYAGDPRWVGSLEAVVEPALSTENTFDLTDMVRGLLRPGEPVTLTVVSSRPIEPVEPLLSLFMSRPIESP